MKRLRFKLKIVHLKSSANAIADFFSRATNNLEFFSGGLEVIERKEFECKTTNLSFANFWQGPLFNRKLSEIQAGGHELRVIIDKLKKRKQVPGYALKSKILLQQTKGKKR